MTPTETPTPRAIVHFRTMRNGAFKFLKGNRRGYWRAIVVNDPAGCLRVGTANVLQVLYEGPEGIDGVTDRSRYNIDGSRDTAQAAADQFNATQQPRKVTP